MRLHLATFLLLASCGADVWHVDYRFSEADEVQLEAAAELWRERGAPVDFIYGQRVNGLDDSRREIVVVGERVMANLDYQAGRDETMALAHKVPLTPRKIFVVLEWAKTEEHLRFVFAHELGHSLGLKHVADETALMHPDWEEGVTRMCVTESDAVEYCRATGCVGREKGCDL